MPLISSVLILYNMLEIGTSITYAYSQGTGGAKRVTDESLQMARNPENAYGIGTSCRPALTKSRLSTRKTLREQRRGWLSLTTS